MSLAVLEVLVHLGDAGVLSSYPAPSGSQEIGDAWVRGGSSVVLEVPSAVVERESDYLINPEHPDFASVNVGDPEPFEFDPRLL